jgi:hypothetical protein
MPSSKHGTCKALPCRCLSGAGVEICGNALWLGNESIATTNGHPQVSIVSVGKGWLMLLSTTVGAACLNPLREFAWVEEVSIAIADGRDAPRSNPLAQGCACLLEKIHDLDSGEKALTRP